MFYLVCEGGKSSETENHLFFSKIEKKKMYLIFLFGCLLILISCFKIILNASSRIIFIV